MPVAEKEQEYRYHPEKSYKAPFAITSGKKDELIAKYFDMQMGEDFRGKYKWREYSVFIKLNKLFFEVLTEEQQEAMIKNMGFITIEEFAILETERREFEQRQAKEIEEQKILNQGKQTFSRTCGPNK